MRIREVRLAACLRLLARSHFETWTLVLARLVKVEHAFSSFRQLTSGFWEEGLEAQSQVSVSEARRQTMQVLTSSSKKGRSWTALKNLRSTNSITFFKSLLLWFLAIEIVSSSRTLRNSSSTEGCERLGQQWTISKQPSHGTLKNKTSDLALIATRCSKLTSRLS